jgi:hypothetical protein
MKPQANQFAWRHAACATAALELIFSDNHEKSQRNTSKILLSAFSQKSVPDSL